VPEPTAEECDGARWESGLVGAYLSLPRRSFAAAPVEEPAPVPVYRPPLRWLPLIGPGAFALTLALSPATALWETRGHVPPAEVFGVPNAPGGVLFQLLARVWALLLSPLLSLDATLTLLGLALAGALATVSFLVVHRVFWGVGWERAALFGAGLVSLGLAAGLGYLRTIGPGGSAHLMGATLLTAGCWMVVRWRDVAPAPRSRRYLLAGAYLGVLGAAGSVLWPLPLASAALLLARFAPGISERLSSGP
jgi:hypothetical protein